jgi:hypothetical protein
MDFEKQKALTACGTCGHQEWEHQGAAGDGDALDVLAALGGACRHFTISAAALAYAKHLAIANSPANGRKPGPRCQRCGNRGHTKKDCPL